MHKWAQIEHNLFIQVSIHNFKWVGLRVGEFSFDHSLIGEKFQQNVTRGGRTNFGNRCTNKHNLLMQLSIPNPEWVGLKTLTSNLAQFSWPSFELKFQMGNDRGIFLKGYNLGGGGTQISKLGVQMSTNRAQFLHPVSISHFKWVELGVYFWRDLTCL